MESHNLTHSAVEFSMLVACPLHAADIKEISKPQGTPKPEVLVFYSQKCHKGIYVATPCLCPYLTPYCSCSSIGLSFYEKSSSKHKILQFKSPQTISTNYSEENCYKFFQARLTLNMSSCINEMRIINREFDLIWTLSNQIPPPTQTKNAEREEQWTTS